MLQEIFKGMDNASEAINENFSKVDIVQGENENGSYVKFGNGLIVAWHKTSTHTTGLYEWTYPIPYSTPPIVVATPQQTTNNSAYIGVNFGVTAGADSVELRKWGSNGMNYPFAFVSIGY